jgi:Protein of unknown function (DUF3429)
MTDSSVPRAARLLGLAGLLPSLAMVVVLIALPGARGAAAAVGLAYGALIASFVGGAWWGLAAARAQAPPPRLLALSVVPSLLAWPALLLRPEAGLLMLAIIFAALVPTDRRLQREAVAPAWWLALRRPLSFGMAALHAAAAGILAFSGPGLPG